MLPSSKWRYGYWRNQDDWNDLKAIIFFQRDRLGKLNVVGWRGRLGISRDVARILGKEGLELGQQGYAPKLDHCIIIIIVCIEGG